MNRRAERLSALGVYPEDIAKYVLVCGDPKRAEMIAAKFDSAREMGFNREYRSFTGEINGVRMSAVSHGVGGSGAACCFEQLIYAGARAIIRVGTCGAWAPGIKSGDILVGTAAGRAEGFTYEQAPSGYPAVSNIDLVRALISQAKKRGVNFRAGIMMSHDAFYGGVMPSPFPIWMRTDAVGVEQELAALLVISSLRGIRAAGVFAVDGAGEANYFKVGKYNPYNPTVDKAKDDAIEIGIRAMLEFVEAENKGELITQVEYRPQKIY
ncbi:MAG: nucleoside phosphorylase [Bacillota bacterium]|jgi:uridine phosphorylase